MDGAMIGAMFGMGTMAFGLLLGVMGWDEGAMWLMPIGFLIFMIAAAVN